MISAEVMKARLQEGEAAEFDLVFWKGTGRVLGAGDDKLSLQVRGKRADTPGLGCATPGCGCSRTRR